MASSLRSVSLLSLLGNEEINDEPTLKERRVFDAAEAETTLLLGPAREVNTGLGQVPAVVRSSHWTRIVVPIVTLTLIAVVATSLVLTGKRKTHSLVVVELTTGEARGFHDGIADVWLGIPYGQAKRWQAPKMASKWGGRRDFRSRAAICPQQPALGYDLADLPQAESCLTLEVFAPRGHVMRSRVSPGSVDPLPIVVFLHGGEFVVGSSAQQVYNASQFAQANHVIVVAPQFRLGALGFLAHPALTASAGTSGNFGLLDQQLALQWVHANACAFNGDSARVSLWGQGSGGTASLLHLSMPGSFGRFGVVLSSSGPVTKDSVPSRAQVEGMGVEFAKLIGCHAGNTSMVLQCLRQTPLDTVVRATFSGRYRQGWQPAWDGRVLEEDPTAVFRNGFKLKTGIPRGAILGGALNDSSSLLPYRLMFPLQREEPVHELRESDIVPAIAALFGNESGRALTIASWYKERHPFTEGASRENMRLVAQAATDGSVLCPYRKLAQWTANAGVPTYVYRQDVRLQFVPPEYGASRFQDASLLFGHPCFITCDHQNHSRFTREEGRLSAGLQQAWARFAAGKEPSTDKGTVPHWPRFRTDENPHEEFLAWRIPNATVRSYSTDMPVCATLWA